MPVQSSSDYPAFHDAAFEGQRDSLQLINSITKVAEGSNIEFGRAVVRGTADNQATLPSASTDEFIGVTEYTSAGVTEDNGFHGYNENSSMNVVDFGVIWVYVEQAVVPGDPVFFRYTANTAPLDILGRFRKDADPVLTVDTAKVVVGAIFETTAAAGTLAKIKIR